jgi:hypothetical protein
MRWPVAPAVKMKERRHRLYVMRRSDNADTDVEDGTAPDETERCDAGISENGEV